MKREFAKLSRVEQERVELEYHRTKPEGFDDLMAGAKPHSPDAIRLPHRLVETLKTVAKTEGEPEYKTMVRRWVEERLRQETKLAPKSSKRSYSKKAAFRRQVVK
jgi:hypothetical protein